MERLVESYSGSIAGIILSVLFIAVIWLYLSPIPGLMFLLTAIAATPMLLFIDDIAIREQQYLTHRQFDNDIEEAMNENHS